MAGVKGHCLCGAVQVVVADMPATLSACHCSMCQRWSGGIQMGIEVRPENVAFSGPVKTYASTSFSERAWCEVCGSALWLRDTVDGAQPYELVPGLFQNAGGAVLHHEIYADCCPEAYALAGDHPRISKEDYEARHRHVSEGDTK